MRQIVLDTETTGIEPKEGHRIIEIGCVEVVNRRLTGNHFHVYINPGRQIEQEAIEVHGITNEFLADKPIFSQVAQEFVSFIKGAQLVIHNAPFDVGFMDHEFAMESSTKGVVTSEMCDVLDTLNTTILYYIYFDRIFMQNDQTTLLNPSVHGGFNGKYWLPFTRSHF